MSDIRCRIQKHDAHHLELKAHLPIPERGKGRYDLSFYFFSPAQLHMNKADVGVEKVLKHCQTYTRFSSPIVPLAGLIDESCTLSPLYRLKEHLNGLQLTGEIDENRIIYELQTLVNAYRSDIKGLITLVRKLSDRENTAAVHYKDQVSQTISQTEELLTRLRELFPAFLHPRIGENLRTALEWTDEAVTLIAEQRILELRGICDEIEEFRDKIAEMDQFLEGVSAYREQQRYSSSYDEEHGRDGELVAYRESILKKWSQSAMYMKAIDSKLPARLNQVFAATAAALAMAFAVTAAAYADTIFIRNSAPWAMIIIISYVFKDRIKEILRGLFGRLMPRLLADRIVRLIDPATQKDAAKAQVLVRFGTDRVQPERIRSAREMQKNPFSSILPPQDVIHFNRIVTLNSRVLKAHERVEALSEITRVRIDEWLKSMDDPKDTMYKLVDGKREKIKSGRVYHIHLIVSLREQRKDTDPHLFHYCLIMNREGLIRIEER